MARLGTGLALMAGVLLAGCSDPDGVPVYVGDELLTTLGGPAPGATTAPDGTVVEAPQGGGFRLGSIFAAEETPIFVGGQRINCPADQPDC